MNIKLIAFDLDGTTITEHKYLSERNRRALERAGEKGVYLVPATGRMKDFLPPEITAIKGVRYAITANGGAIFDLKENKAVYERLIPNEKAIAVQKLLDPHDIYIEYYSNGRAMTKIGFPEKAKTHFKLPPSKWHFVEDKDYALVEDFGEMLKTSGLCPEKINLPYLSEELRAQLWRELSELGGLRLTSSIPDNIEINDITCDKGAAVLALAEMLSVDPESVMTMGDNINDETMLQAVSCSVAVADGAPEALKAAKYTTAAHDKDGVAEAIERFVFWENT